MVPENIRESFAKFSLDPKNKIIPISERAKMFNLKYQVEFTQECYRNLLK